MGDCPPEGCGGMVTCGAPPHLPAECGASNEEQCFYVAESCIPHPPPSPMEPALPMEPEPGRNWNQGYGYGGNGYGSPGYNPGSTKGKRKGKGKQYGGEQW